ncbi:uncharacterized protein LOC128245474 isoform X2 [Mya arenaria]|nr:uncharacterized protein LOC128245474 isoform X2 [Mya arenaria]XP_052819616.1 uncharacterized protein LOC128245474 isoform X2 [Mya arenaria]
MGRRNNSYIRPTTEMELEKECSFEPRQINIIDSLPCCHSIKNKLGFKIALYLILVSTDLIDVLSDWLLFRDVISTEEGLVFGPVEDILKYLLLAFSVIGTFTYIFEMSNYWWEIFRSNPWVDVDLLMAIIIWIEDVPQITINVLIVACREEAISYFQLVKASIIIIGAVIRVLISLIRYCGKTARRDVKCARLNKYSRYHVVYRFFIMIGLILTLGGAVTIFMFTQSERHPDGRLDFKTPHSILEGKYDDEKYFKNVSIYFSHPSLQEGQASSSPEDVNFIRLLKINEIRKSETDQTVKIFVNKNENSTDFSVIVGPNAKTECFKFWHSSGKVDSEFLTTNITCAESLSSPDEQWTFIFHYKKPSAPRLIFGDIKYNIKTNTSMSQCGEPQFEINTMTTRQSKTTKTAALRYFRTKGATPETDHILVASPDKGTRFYRTKDLVNIADVWRTGFALCKSSGSMAPNRDTSISVPCDLWT